MKPFDYIQVNDTVYILEWLPSLGQSIYYSGTVLRSLKTRITVLVDTFPEKEEVVFIRSTGMQKKNKPNSDITMSLIDPENYSRVSEIVTLSKHKAVEIRAELLYAIRQSIIEHVTLTDRRSVIDFVRRATNLLRQLAAVSDEKREKI